MQNLIEDIDNLKEVRLNCYKNAIHFTNVNEMTGRIDQGSLDELWNGLRSLDDLIKQKELELNSFNKDMEIKCHLEKQSDPVHI